VCPALRGMGAQVSQQTTNRSFDELAKGLAGGTISRSRALRLMGTVVLGGVLASIPGVAWAQQRGRGGGGGSAQGRCPEGTVNCRGKCVILAEDRNNCGGCGVVCPEGRLCVGGTCCPTERVCGSGTSATCCAAGQRCLPASTTGELTCCPEGQMCGTGATATCCTGGSICHTSGVCCFRGGVTPPTPCGVFPAQCCPDATCFGGTICF
jgi:Stigma-specific protein, Stig1